MKKPSGGARAGERYRVLVTTDIGGSDPDDFQSMVHYLLYSDLFDTEGLISSPWGAGTVQDIFTVINQYEKDYASLRAYSERYPEPDVLRALTKQGALEPAPYRGYQKATEGSDWIIHCAKKKDERPLYLLMWGLLEDLAQALHDAPEIMDKLRVYYIGGPNKKWGPNAYEYIRRNFPDLWMIENNSTYRGWFNGGDQSGSWGNQSFVSAYAADRGALGRYFTTHLGGVIKMGDTPSVSWLLRGNPEQPEEDSWGGRFMRIHNFPFASIHGNPTLSDTIEVFGTLELIFQGPDCGMTQDETAFVMEVKGQEFNGYYCGNGEYRIRFVPKETGEWFYQLKSPIPELDGQTGGFRSVPESYESRMQGNLTHWWSDILGPEWAEGPHMGARTVNQWRRDFLQDFGERLQRLEQSEE